MKTTIYQDTPESLLRLIIEEKEPECCCRPCLHCRIKRVLKMPVSEPLGQGDWQRHRRAMHELKTLADRYMRALSTIVNSTTVGRDYYQVALEWHRVAALALDPLAGESDPSRSPPHVATPAEDRGDGGDKPSEGGQT